MVDKEYLRRHAENRKELQDELQRYELDHGRSYYGKSPSDIDGMPHAQGGISDRTFNNALKPEDMGAYINDLQAKILEEKREIENALKLLKKACQKSVIRYKYYNCLDWDDVAFYMYGGRRDYVDREEYYKQKAQKVHGAALANMIRQQQEEEGL